MSAPPKMPYDLTRPCPYCEAPGAGTYPVGVPYQCTNCGRDFVRHGERLVFCNSRIEAIKLAEGIRLTTKLTFTPSA